MTEVDELFATRLQASLSDRQLSQAELGRRTGIGRSTLNKIVTGKRQPNAQQLGAIAHELELDLLELMGVAAALQEHGDLERQVRVAKELADQKERARTTAAAGEARLAEQLVQLDAELAKAASEREASERECAKLQSALDEARALIKLLEGRDGERFQNRDPSPSTKSWPLSAIHEDRYAPAKRNADLIGDAVGGIARTAVRWLVYMRGTKLIDDQR